MIIRKAAYTKTYPIANLGVWEKIYIEADINEGEDVRQCLYDLKKQVENFHYESNKAAEKQMGTQVDVEPKVGNIINDIKSCKSIKVLESYQMLVKNKPDLQAAYDEQLKKLTP